MEIKNMEITKQKLIEAKQAIIDAEKNFRDLSIQCIEQKFKDRLGAVEIVPRFAYGYIGKQCRITGFKINYAMEVSVYAIVLKKDGTESKNTIYWREPLPE